MPVSPRLAGRRVESQIADLEHARPLGRAAADECPQSGEQLGERERLHEIVVRPGVQSGDAILDTVARGQHEHGCPHASLAEPLANLDAVQSGKHEIEDDRVVRDCARHAQRTVAGSLDVDGVPVLDEPACEEAGHLQLVLGDQDSHLGDIVSRG